MELEQDHSFFSVTSMYIDSLIATHHVKGDNLISQS